MEFGAILCPRLYEGVGIINLSQKSVVIGLNQTKKALLKDSVAVLYIAEDADKRLRNPIEQLAQEKNIVVQQVPTMKTLGKEFGIDVGAAAGAVLK